MRLGTLEITADSRRLHVSRVSHKGGSAPPPSTAEIPAEDFREVGATGHTSYGTGIVDEYLSELKGKKFLKVIDQMKRSDAQVRSGLMLVKSPVLSAQWYVQPASDSEEDIEVAEFVDWCLHNMHRTFLRIVADALRCLDYDHYVFEKVFETAEWTPSRKGAHTRIVHKWADWSPRPPVTLEDVEYDDNGHPTGWWHVPGGRRADRKLLNWRKLLVFTWDGEADNPRGMSILRSAYRHWFYKHNLYKVDAIQKERHGIGIPRVKLSQGFKKEDKNIANEIGRNLRTNEKAHVTELPNFVVDFIEMKGQPVDALESADHHNYEIAKNVLVQFLNSRQGSNAKDESHIDLFVKALKFLGDYIRGVINQDAIPQLVDYNFDVKKYPTLRVRRIAENVEWRTMSVALRNLSEPGFITPDDATEEWLRDQMDFPLTFQKRSVKDRITKGGTRGGAPGGAPAANGNRPDQGNADTGTSPSGNPTE